MRGWERPGTNEAMCHGPVFLPRLLYAKTRASTHEDLAARLNGVIEIERHRRYQRLHEIRAVGGRDIGSQSLRLKFSGNDGTDRGDARSFQPLTQAILATM